MAHAAVRVRGLQVSKETAVSKREFLKTAVAAGVLTMAKGVYPVSLYSAR